MSIRLKRAPARRAAKSSGLPGLGSLPEWNLADLYAGLDDPRIKRDLDRGAAESLAFERDYKGKLAALADGPEPGARLGEAIERYVALDDLLGRLTSYAGLIHAGDTADPARAKFYADVQERVTAASTHLLFFTLELNRLNDAKLEAAMQDGALAHYRPWIEDIRKEKPYQLEDRVEQLFHEKSVTGYSAWTRLFDETIAGLRFKVGSKVLALEPTLHLLQDPRKATRKAASEALAKTFKQNLRSFALITNVLTKDKEISDRWRGFADVADARHLSNRVEREVVDALVDAVRAAYPRLSHRYYALKAHWFGKKRLPHWDRNAPLPKVATRTIGWREAQDTMLTAKVEDMLNTVVRQIAFYSFERKLYTERKAGELTAERLDALWLDVQRESLGPAIELKPGYETFWAYIPHFVHSPFYVYAYAFGDCLVNSLYAVYERAAEGFAERYLQMLAAGGTKHHSELLAPFGLDARDPAFWQEGLGVIERMIGELEGLD